MGWRWRRLIDWTHCFLLGFFLFLGISFSKVDADEIKCFECKNCAKVIGGKSHGKEDTNTYSCGTPDVEVPCIIYNDGFSVQRDCLERFGQIPNGTDMVECSAMVLKPKAKKAHYCLCKVTLCNNVEVNMEDVTTTTMTVTVIPVTEENCPDGTMPPCVYGGRPSSTQPQPVAAGLQAPLVLFLCLSKHFFPSLNSLIL